MSIDLWTDRPINKVKQAYINIKPIEEKCIRTNTNECDSKEIVFKYKYNNEIIEIVKFIRSKATMSLRQYEGVNKIIKNEENLNIHSYDAEEDDFEENDFEEIDDEDYAEENAEGEEKGKNLEKKINDDKNHKIIQIDDDESETDILNFNNIFDYNVDEILYLYDKGKKTRLSIRIRFIIENNFENMLMSLSIIMNLKDPNTDSLSLNKSFGDLIIYYSFKMDKPYNEYLYAAEAKYICNQNSFGICLDGLLKTYNSEGKYEDKIYENSYLDILVEDTSQTISIKYKYIEKGIKDTEDYPVGTNIDCNINCNNKKSCNFETIGNLHNAKCTCGDYFYGIDCKHKYNCANCADNKCTKDNTCTECKKGWKGPNCNQPDCNTLNMCGSNGQCVESATNRECRCDPNYSGKYCTKYTPPPSTTDEKNNHVTTNSNDQTESRNGIHQNDAKISEFKNQIEFKKEIDQTTAKSSEVKIAVGAIFASILGVVLIAGFTFYIFKQKT